MIRVVVDTTVFVSGLARPSATSPAREVIDRGLASHFEPALSPHLIQEIARKLAAHGMASDAIVDLLTALAAVAHRCQDVEYDDISCRDPNDVFVRCLARTASAACIVTQDEDLLDPTFDPRGCRPGFFLARLREFRNEPEGTRFP